MVALGPENRAPKGIAVDPEEFFSGILAEIATGKPCLFIVEDKGVLFSPSAEGPEHAICLISPRPDDRATVDAASPGAVAQTLAAVLASAVVAVKPIEHHFEESGEGRFSPSVFGEQDAEPILEMICKIPEFAEIFYAAGNKLHKRMLLNNTSEQRFP